MDRAITRPMPINQFILNKLSYSFKYLININKNYYLLDNKNSYFECLNENF